MAIPGYMLHIEPLFPNLCAAWGTHFKIGYTKLALDFKLRSWMLQSGSKVHEISLYSNGLSWAYIVLLNKGAIVHISYGSAEGQCPVGKIY